MKRPGIHIWRTKGPLRRIVDFAYRRVPQDPSGGVIKRTAEILECGHRWDLAKVAYGPPPVTRRRCRQCAKAIEQAAMAARRTMNGNPAPLREIVGPPWLSRRKASYGRLFDPMECGHNLERQRPKTGMATQKGRRRRCQPCHWERTDDAVARAVIEMESTGHNLAKGIGR